MPGINTTGQSKTRDYTLGRGCVLLAPLNDHDIPGEWREIGNASTFRISAESETLEHFSSKSVSRVKDAEVALETSANVEVVIDEINFDNLSTFFVGEANQYTMTAGAIVAGQVGVPNPGWTAGTPRVIGGRYYELYNDGAGNFGLGFQGAAVTNSHDNRLYDLVDTGVAADITITANGTGYPNDGTNFTVDFDNGLIFVLEGSGLETDLGIDAAAAAVTTEFVIPVASTIAVAAGVLANSTTMDEARAFTSASQTVAVKYIMLNANDNGHPTEVHIHKIRFTPNGDLDLLSGDAFAEITLQGSAEANAAADTDSEFITIRSRRV